MKRGKTLHTETGSEGAKNEVKKMYEKKNGGMTEKTITFVICRVES